jgi:hypothetical protein
MRKLVVIISILLIAISGLCQDTKTIVKKSDSQVLQAYSVLKSDKSIKHGKYISFYRVTKSRKKEIKKSEDLSFPIKEAGYYNM